MTLRQTQIVELIMKGMSNKEIAETLRVSGHTVKAHLNRLYRQENVRGRLQLAMKVQLAMKEAEMRREARKIVKELMPKLEQVLCDIELKETEG